MPIRRRSSGARPGVRPSAGIVCLLVLCTACVATIPTRSLVHGSVIPDPAPTATLASARPWLDVRKPIEQRVAELLWSLTLDEKVRLMFGVQPPSSSPAAGYIPGIPRLGVPPQIFSDGPVGLRDSATAARRATALPATVSLAASFHPSLAKAYGALLGNEARARGVSVLYGPAMNIVRVPVGGRNFEYFSEDPYLTAQLAVPYVQGVQSQRVAAQIKHFALNNQENARHTASSNAGERTMRETYLPAWQAAVQQGHAWSVMCGNNPVNHVYACENTWLLRGTLADRWGFDGVVGSDYAGTHSAIGSVNAGLDQSFTLRDWGAFYRDLPQLVRSKRVSESTINERASRVLRMMFRIGLFDGDRTRPAVDAFAHGVFARKVAEEGTVLLRNHRQLLPLQAAQVSSVAVIGPYATRAYTGGGGSSQVVPYYSVSPAQGIAARAGTRVHVASDDGSDVARAVALARRSDVVVVVVGDTSREGKDRTSMDLPGNQNQLVAALTAANPKTVVVLHTGGAVAMPWLAQAHTLLEAWYPGEEHGNALAAVLFGDVDPSGRLPVTFPTGADRVPAMGAPGYPAGPNGYDYGEGLRVGYRALCRGLAERGLPVRLRPLLHALRIHRPVVAQGRIGVARGLHCHQPGRPGRRRGAAGVPPLSERRRGAPATAQGFRARHPCRPCVPARDPDPARPRVRLLDRRELAHGTWRVPTLGREFVPLPAADPLARRAAPEVGRAGRGQRCQNAPTASGGYTVSHGRPLPSTSIRAG